MDDKRLLVAIRRNHQKRGADRFVSAVHDRCGLLITVADILPAGDSVEFEANLARTISDRLAAGAIERTSELRRTDVQQKTTQYFSDHGDDGFSVCMCHYAAFIFRSTGKLLVKAFMRLLEFDGDSLYAVSNDLTYGLGVDKYISELDHDVRYTLDIWK